MTYDSILVALADPTRRQVFESLRAGPRSVGELAAGLPVSRPAVSQHLKVLEQAGLVSGRKVGRRRLYRLQLDGLGALRAWIESFWDDVLGAYVQSLTTEEGETP